MDALNAFYYQPEAHPHPYSHPSAHPSLKTPHFYRQLMHFLESYLHYPSSLPHNAADADRKSSREYFHLPPVDIRTTDKNYYFDIELPGVTDKAGISVHWTSARTFMIEGEIPRPRILLPLRSSNGEILFVAAPEDSEPAPQLSGEGEEKGKLHFGNACEDSQDAPEMKNGSVPKKVLNSDNSAAPNPVAPTASTTFRPDLNYGDPQLVVGERMIGRYRRSFSMPYDGDVDAQGTEASLEAGVLTIRVPRLKSTQIPLVKVPVG